MKALKYFVYVVWAVSFLSCDSGLKLEPEDKRPVKSLAVADGTEAALIAQEMNIEIKYVDNNTVYFYEENPMVLKDLEAIGYTIKNEDPMQTSFKLVKLTELKSTKLTKERNQDADATLREYDVKIMSREEGYWILYGSLESLTKLQREGYSLQNIETEIRPKNIKVRASSLEDVQKVNEFNVDIHSTSRDDNYIIISGGAYDYQIDLLRDSGYEVTIQ